MKANSQGRGRRWLALVAVLGVALSAAQVRAAPDPREITAREHFVAGRYQQALDLFAKLYAETLHPVYLRNVGRCYQNLGEPDRAISTFRDYLRKAKGLTADERTEIDGYIKEMEELKRRHEAAGTAGVTPLPAAGASAPVTPLAASPPPPTADSKVSVVVSAPPPPPPAAASPPIYARWWFWAAVIGVAAVGVGVAAAAGAFTHTQDASCPMDYCP